MSARKHTSHKKNSAVDAGHYHDPETDIVVNKGSTQSAADSDTDTTTETCSTDTDSASDTETSGDFGGNQHNYETTPADISTTNYSLTSTQPSSTHLVSP